MAGGSFNGRIRSLGLRDGGSIPSPPIMRTLVVGDIHGRIEALQEVLVLCKFNYDVDTLVCLGDVADGDVGVKQCFNELLKIKNLIMVIGNHDQWFLEWATNRDPGTLNMLWWNQGGQHTAASYEFKKSNVPQEHITLLQNAKPFAIVDSMIFVHGGFDPSHDIVLQAPYALMWDRQLIRVAQDTPIINPWTRTPYKHIFVGHTTVQIIKNDSWYTTPLTFNNLTMVDTGAGWNGRLTVMDISTKEYWQSKVQTPGPSKKLIKSLFFKTKKTPLTKKVEARLA